MSISIKYMEDPRKIYGYYKEIKNDTLNDAEKIS